MTTLDWVILCTLASLYGWIEQHIYRHGYEDTGWHIFGKINPRYHLPLVAFWLGICYLTGAWWFIGAFAVIEDWWFFRFHQDKKLQRSSWVTFGMGGIGWDGVFFIPTTYFIGVGLTIGFYYINEWIR